MAELFSPIVICGQKVAAASRRGWQGIVFLWDFFFKIHPLFLGQILQTYISPRKLYSFFKSHHRMY